MAFDDVEQPKVDPTFKWPKSHELKVYQQARDRGTVSIFRSTLCGACRTFIPNAFTHCSHECAVLSTKQQAEEQDASASHIKPKPPGTRAR